MKIQVLFLLFVFVVSCYSQSKRPIPSYPDEIGNITAKIMESVSYKSYYGKKDDTDKWFSYDDVGSSVSISDNKVSFYLKNKKGKLNSFLKYVKRVNNVYDLAHNKEEYWKNDCDDHEGGIYGFTIKKDTEIEFHIKVIPEILKDGKEIVYSYHTGKTVITVEKNGKSIWVFYCKNYLQ